jgi:hypothetical protein
VISAAELCSTSTIQRDESIRFKISEWRVLFGPYASFSVRIYFASFLMVLIPTAVRATSISYTGTLASPTDVVEETFTLTSPATIGLQTWSFGGGTNAAGNLILPGGTDPFLGIFFGTGASAAILTDGGGNPYGTSLDLSNYGNPNFLGCPPAAAPLIGGLPQCGDITMTLTSLAAGTYTVILTDGQYIPQAVYDNGTLGEGFNDFTGGTFCNVAINGVNCPNTSGAYAFDITGLPASVPEPAPAASVGAVLLALVLRRTR